MVTYSCSLRGGVVDGARVAELYAAVRKRENVESRSKREHMEEHCQCPLRDHHPAVQGHAEAAIDKEEIFLR